MSDARRWGIRVLAAFLLLAASVAFVGVNAAKHQALSPIDEYVYIDYLAKVSSQPAVAAGEATGAFAREYLDCHGVQFALEPRPEFCGTGLAGSDTDYPFGGANTADLYTPIYFAVTRVLAQPIMMIGGLDLVAAGRLVGSLWLGAAAILLAATLRRMGASRLLSVCAPLLLVGSLPLWWATTFVTTDATAPLAGAAMAYATVRWLQTGRAGWLLPAIATVVTLAKLQNLMAVAACALAIIVLALRREGGPTLKRAVPIVATMLVLPVVGQGLWSVLRPRATEPLSGAQGITQPFTPDALVREVLRFFGSYTSSGRDPLLFNAPGYAVATLLGWVIIAGLLGVLIRDGRRHPELAPGGHPESDGVPTPTRIGFALGLGTIVVSLLGGPLLVAALWATGQGYFPLPSRYALSLFPLALIVTVGFFARTRIGRIALIVGGPLATIAGLFFVFTGVQLGVG
ncbi:hypothetical protein D9V32_07495 [Mycetocola tolaasinivorans]|uniref:DUF2142 domain-containing protein n=1 Tax=Mycetocola tolaasinivorans TaxID=76635 RepID=A0A3L7A6N4_9MICO|nr:hypothetical protein [Mycetocola tolaasinivorans]RLP75993.1 hypothetical protein D9V32_07495 [Mycetocola tolaasinivorans]